MERLEGVTQEQINGLVASMLAKGLLADDEGAIEAQKKEISRWTPDAYTAMCRVVGKHEEAPPLSQPQVKVEEKRPNVFVRAYACVGIVLAYLFAKIGSVFLKHLIKVQNLDPNPNNLFIRLFDKSLKHDEPYSEEVLNNPAVKSMFDKVKKNKEILKTEGKIGFIKRLEPKVERLPKVEALITSKPPSIEPGPELHKVIDFLQKRTQEVINETSTTNIDLEPIKDGDPRSPRKADGTLKHPGRRSAKKPVKKKKTKKVSRRGSVNV